MDGINSFTDVLFGMDIVLNFFTTMTDPFTGEELTDRNEIACLYLKGQFWLDLMCTVPFDNLFSTFLTNAHQLSVLQMIKLIRIFRLTKIINYMTTTDDVKDVIKLVKTVFLLVFYIHVVGCLWFYIGKFNGKTWIPS